MLQIKHRKHIVQEDIDYIESAFFAKRDIEQLLYQENASVNLRGLSTLLNRPIGCSHRADAFLMADILDKIDNYQLLVIKPTPIQPLVDSHELNSSELVFIRKFVSIAYRDTQVSLNNANNTPAEPFDSSESVEPQQSEQTSAHIGENTRTVAQPSVNKPKFAVTSKRIVDDKLNQEESTDSSGMTTSKVLQSVSTGVGIATETVNTRVRSIFKQQAVDILAKGKKLHIDKIKQITATNTVKGLNKIIKSPKAASAKMLRGYGTYMKLGSKLPLVGHAIAATSVGLDVENAPEGEKLSTGISSGLDVGLSAVTYVLGGVALAALGIAGGPIIAGSLFIFGGTAASLSYASFASDKVRSVTKNLVNAVEQEIKEAGWFESFTSDNDGYKVTIKDPANNRN